MYALNDDRIEESAWDVKKILEDGKLRDNCNSRAKEVKKQVPDELQQIDNQIFLQHYSETTENCNSGHVIQW